MGNELDRRPPRLKLTVRIGVTGHLFQELEDDPKLSSSIKQVLQAVQDLATLMARRSDFAFLEKAECRFLSPLAEGADRAGAKVALDLNLPMDCLLPFREDIYIRSFKGGIRSVAEFTRLKKLSVNCLELDGGEDHEDARAFSILAEALVANSDLLLAVWDGEKGKAGGTQDVVSRALAAEVPVIWFAPDSQDEPRLLEALEPQVQTHRGNLILALENRFSRQFAFDTDEEDSTGWWDRVLACLGKSGSEQARAKEFFDESLRSSEETASAMPTSDWCKLLCRLSDYGKRHRAITESFQPPFEWADYLAGFYSRRYQQSFKASYLLGAAAVFMAFLSYFSPTKEWPYHVTTWAELALIGFILLLTISGGVFRWHERWLEYRWLAEVLRQRHFLAPVPWKRTLFRASAHLGPISSGRRWSAVYLACLLRQAPLPSGRVDGTYLKYCRATILAFMETQETYHKDRAKAQKKRAHRYHSAGLALFAGAVAGCIWHLIGVGYEFVSGFMVIVLPAFASAIGAILHHSELEQQVKHSEALAGWLKVAGGDLSRDSSLGREVIEANAARLSEAMMDELVDWRDAFLDKPVPSGH